MAQVFRRMFEESSLKAGREMLRNALCVQAALGSDRDDIVLHGVILSVTQRVEENLKRALWRSLRE